MTAHDGERPDGGALTVGHRPIPDWLRSAAGPLGQRLVALREATGHREIEVDTQAHGPLFLSVHAPGTPHLPFSSSAFGVGYRAGPGLAEAMGGALCRQFGLAIASVPEAGARLLALTGSAAGPQSACASEADASVLLALGCVARGDLVGALAAWRGVVVEDVAPHLAAQACQLFSSVEGREMRGEIPPRPPPAEPASRAWALAWAGDLVGARRLAEAQSDGPDAWAVRGVVDVLERRSASGLVLLDRALAAGADNVLHLHRARALLHLGRFAEVDRTLSRIVERESLGQRVIKALAAVRRGLLFPTFARWCRRVAASDYQFNGLFGTELPALVGRDVLDRAFDSRTALIDLLESLLDRMAGNLGESSTFAEVGPMGPRFVRIFAPPPPRTPAVEALHALRYLGPAGTEAALTELLTRRPRSVHAYTHRGELYLWLGRYDEAWRDFEAARRIEAVRWADIGLVAVLALKGRLRLARLAAWYAQHHFMSSIPGGTLPVYRGVLRRRMGDLEGAIVDFRAALAVKPTRLGARMELCLALRAAGLAEAASQHAEMVMRDAVPLLVDAADALGVGWRTDPARLTSSVVVEEALRAMRGNRSSGLVTWIDQAGTLRVLAPLAELRMRATQVLAAQGVSQAPAGS